MGGPALRRRVRVRRRRSARALSEGSDLAFFTVRLHDPASPRLAHDPIPASRLAGRPAARTDWAPAARAGARRALEQSPSVVHADADLGARHGPGAARDR